MNRAFSKILILVILITLAGGGIFAWQYLGISEKEIKDETADWLTYKNEEYSFEVDYPGNSTNIKYDANSFEAFLPLESDTRLSEKVFLISVREEEYDQPISYYCAQGVPYTSMTIFREVEFCKSDEGEDAEKNLAVRRFAYHTIHNGKWISLFFRFVSCVPGSPDDTCGALPEFDENKEKEIFNQMLSTFRFLETEREEEIVVPER